MAYQIKCAGPKDLRMVLDWATEEGWNPGLHDDEAFFTIDENGFFIGYLDEKPVACISAVKYSTDFGFLGFYIVQPKYRGKNLGYQIWQYAINYLSGCNIGLDGVVAEQNNYQKSGFKLAHRNIRYVLPENNVSDFSNTCLMSTGSLPINLMTQYDQAFFPCLRNTFLVAWLSMRNAIGLTYYDHVIKGYGVIRKCHLGYKIGPLFADNIEIARTLYQGLCAAIENKAPIFLDVPEINYQAMQLTKEFAMRPVFETARMYTKTVPSISIDRTFGITTFEVG